MSWSSVAVGAAQAAVAAAAAVVTDLFPGMPESSGASVSMLAWNRSPGAVLPATSVQLACSVPVLAAMAEPDGASSPDAPGASVHVQDRVTSWVVHAPLVYSSPSSVVSRTFPITGAVRSMVTAKGAVRWLPAASRQVPP